MITTTYEPEEVLAAIQPERRVVVRRLRALRRKLRRHLLVSGLTRFVGLLLLLCAASYLVDRTLRLERSTRIALEVAAAIALVVAAWRWVISPLLLRLNDLDLAEVIERRQAGLGQRITDVLQLPDLLANPEYASPSLVRQAVLDHARELEQFDLQRLVDVRRHVRNLCLLLALIAVPALAIAAWPQTSQLWARRWLLGENIRWPQSTYLALEGLGDGTRLLAPRGEDVVLHLSAQPAFTAVENGWQLAGRGKPLFVEASESPTSEIPEQVGIVVRSAAGSEKQGNFTRFAGADFRYELPPLVEPVDVEVRGGDDWFGPVRVEPIDRPSVASLTLIARPPGSATDERHDVGAADDRLMFLPQTKLELRVTASEPLKLAELVAQDQPSERLEQVDATNFRTAWTMDDARTFELRLVAAESGLTSKPYFLTIGLLHDREPRLTIRASGVGKRVTPQARIPLAVHAVDDFGLGELGLELERVEAAGDKSKTTISRLALEKYDADPKRPLPLAIDATPTLKLAEHGLAAGQTMRLRATAQDRSVLEHHTGVSRWLGFLIVTPEELFYDILMRQREQRTKFAASLTIAKTQIESLENLAGLDGVAPLLRSHQAIARQVGQVANSLDAILQEMTLNELSTPAARELLEEKIIKPLRELHAGPLSQLRGRIDELAAGEQIDEARRTAALESQKAVVRGMEQILAQMQQWESFVDVVNQLRQIIKLQTQLRDSTEDVKKQMTEDLFDK